MPQKLPNLIIIGAMKCATTSLHYYLSLHPDISMSRVKELRYFVKEHNWHRGIEWYKSHFTDGISIRGEASPAYTKYPHFKDIAARMYATVPEAKLIYIVRDPINRILSHYMHYFTIGYDKRTLTDVLQELDDNNIYVALSKYYMQLEQYLAYYPKQHIFILTTEELYTHRVETLQKVFKFLGVSPSFNSAKFSRVKHPTSEKRRLNQIGQRLMNFSEKHINRYYPGLQRYLVRCFLCYPFSQHIEIPHLDERLRRDLEQVLREDMQKLRAFTGYHFSEWSI
jgi:hypothetical protein